MPEILLTEKRCRKCGEIKPIAAFSKQKSQKDGHQIYCKACFAQYHVAYTEDNMKVAPDTLPIEKQCTKCGEIRPLDAFPRDKSKKDGHHGCCKICKSQTGRAWRVANADVKRAIDKAYREANIDKVRQRQKAWRTANTDKIRERNHAYQEANKDKLRAQSQAYYRAHADAIRARTLAYYKTNFEIIRVKRQAYRAANREAKRIRDRAYREANREAVRAYHRAYQAIHAEALKEYRLAYHEANSEAKKEYLHAYYAANREALRAYSRAWRKANPDVCRAASQRRRALVKANGGHFSGEELADMRRAQNGICAYCKAQHDPDDLSIDHVIPLRQGGPHEAANIVLACLICNSSKGNRTPEQWTNRWYLRKPKEDQNTEE
jgi:5-methylcytosine-specific restriction endonuclease McrA